MVDVSSICYEEEDVKVLNPKVGKRARPMVGVGVAMEEILQIVVRVGMRCGYVPVRVNLLVVQLIQVQDSVLLASIEVEENQKLV